MNSYRFTLPIYGVVKNKLLSLNWYRNAHYRANNGAKKKFKKLIHDQLTQFDPIEGKVKIRYVLYAKRKNCDLDNVTSVIKKYFQDALVEYGLLAEDSVSVVVASSERYGGVDKENPRIEAEIIQLG